MEENIYNNQLFLMWWGMHSRELLNDIKEIQRQAKQEKDTFTLEHFPTYILTYLDKQTKSNIAVALLTKYGWEFPKALTHELALIHGKELGI